MTARFLDGALAAASIKSELIARVAALRARGIVPGLATVLVGEDPASLRYIAGKHRDCAEVGIESIRRDLPASASQASIEAVIDELNADPACTGLVVQLPLPAHVDTDAVLGRVSPSKDADGLHPANLGHLVLNPYGPLTTPIPCTPRAILELLARYDVPVRGADVVVVGRGLTVGRVFGVLATRREYDATVTLTHTGTADLHAHLRHADVVVAAAGVPGLVRGASIKPGAAVLDVGITRVVDPESGAARMVGDLAPDVAEVAGWISPNPGGVGPMTRAMLLTNVVEIAERT